MDKFLWLSGLVVATLIGFLVGQGLKLPPIPTEVGAWLTPITAAAAIGQAFFAFWALNGLRHAQRQADVAGEGLAVMKTTAQRQLRAYVTVKVATFVLPDGDSPLTFALDICNSGQTPAYDVRFGGRFATSAIDEPLPALFTAAEFRETNTARATIGANDYSRRPVYQPDFSQAQHQGYLNAERKMVLEGRILYRDIFGVEHETGFRFVARADTDMGHLHMIRTEHGNDAT